MDSTSTAAAITPDAILAGIGHASRGELCGLIALLESCDALGLVRGTAESVGRRVGAIWAEEGARVAAQREALISSALPDGILRHRLWHALAGALAVPTVAPLSTASSRCASAALAVRAAERLTPSLAAERGESEVTSTPAGRSKHLVASAARVRAIFKGGKGTLSFPEVVERELLRVLSDGGLMDRATGDADPDVAKALRQGQRAAQAALAAGGGWAAFAAVVANAGFAPYLLAAQASAYIQLVAGPTLTSLLFVLVSPATLLVGIGAIGWLGVGRGARTVRSSVAARLAVLLAVQGVRDREEGLARFIADQRRLGSARRADMVHLGQEELAALRGRLARLEARLANVAPEPAGPPPAPWNVHVRGNVMPDAAVDGVAVTTLTAGETLWHAAAIDRNVIAAADFSRAADLGDPVAFALHAQDFALGGASHSLRGYAAERLVLDRLVADGHDVALASASNTPGLDLVVDGLPVQVKCGRSLSLLEEHFARYPDIPVIANAELAALAAESGADWAALVTTVPGFGIEALEAGIAEALGHAADLGAPDVLGFALSVGLLRGGIEVWRGRIPAADLPAWLLVDGATRGVLALGGAQAGLWVGLVAIGPAGALILGPLAGAAAQAGAGWGREQASRVILKDWHAELLERAGVLHGAVVAAAERRIVGLAARLEAVEERTSTNGLMPFWLRRRAADDLVAALEARDDVGEAPVSEAEVLALLIDAVRIAPADGAILRARRAVERHLEARPGLGASMTGWVRGNRRPAGGSVTDT